MADETFLEKFDLLMQASITQQSAFSLPTSLLIDASANIAVIYQGPVSGEQLEHDVRLLNVDTGRRADAAVPFAGKWFSDVPEIEVTALAELFRKQGFAGDAAAWLRMHLEREPDDAEAHHYLGMAQYQQGNLTEAIESYRRAV